MNTDTHIAFTFTMDGTTHTAIESVGFQPFPEPVNLIGGIPVDICNNADGTISVWQNGKCVGTTVKP